MTEAQIEPLLGEGYVRGVPGQPAPEHASDPQR
jgi:hypothetical protein